MTTNAPNALDNIIELRPIIAFPLAIVLLSIRYGDQRVNKFSLFGITFLGAHIFGRITTNQPNN
jgi:hypothetical protein